MHKGFILLLFVLPVMQACTKVKPDIGTPLRGNQVITSPGSSIRLFNFYNASLDIKVNNIPLTAFSPDPAAQGNQLGLSLFPSNVWTSADNGSPVTLPGSLLDKQSSAHLVIRPRSYFIYFPGLSPSRQPANFNIDTVIVDDPLHPRDYYATADGHLRVIDRNAQAPSSPDRFKIRILNLSAPKDTLGLNGNLVLTYADGTPVHSALNSVAPGTISDYTELPYGSYQFKLFIAKSPGVPDYTRQLAELPVYPDLTNGVPSAQFNLVTKVRGFQPGATYSLVVTPTIFGYDLDGTDNPVFFLFNAYRVITEQNAPVNNDWARLQVVNALSSQPVSFLVDGQRTGTGLGWGQAGDYTDIVKGTHKVQTLDAGGKLLAEQSIVLSPFDNITAWAYPGSAGAAIVFTNTDFTSTLYESTAKTVVNDGTSGLMNTAVFPYAFQTRFLNLGDVPYATFTQDGNLLAPSGFSNNIQNDTFAYPQAYTNLQPGLPVLYNPFVVFPSVGQEPITKYGLTYMVGRGRGMKQSFANLFPLRAYASAPATGTSARQVPGAILAGVAPLTMRDFADSSLVYPDGRLRAENGFYTVALIGNASASSSSGPARLIVIKHNK